MAKKTLEDISHEIEVNKEVLASMPVNNAKNLSAYKKKIESLKTEYSKYRDDIYEELEKRTGKYLDVKPNARTEIVEHELNSLNSVDILNPINTPYEKLRLDTLFYSLAHYYKDDLENVNNDIKKAIEIYKNVGINLTHEDFCYSDYAEKYIEELTRDDSIDRMKDIFEDLHWKCPDLILHIEVSLRIIYHKNIKLFEKYIEDQQRAILSGNMTVDDYVMKRTNLGRELYDLKNYDTFVILNKFMNNELLLNDYNTVSVGKSYGKFLGDNYDISFAKEKVEDFKNLYNNLEEYRNYSKFSYVLDDVKKKFQDKTKQDDKIKSINDEIEKLIKSLEKSYNSLNTETGFLFFKHKADPDKAHLEINTSMEELDKKFDEYDNISIDNQLKSKLNETSTIFDALWFVLSFKTYLRTLIKSLDDTVTIGFIKERVSEFESFLYDPTVNVIKNINLNANDDVGLVIIDHYRMFNINITQDDIADEDTIKQTRKALLIIINSYYMEQANLDINFITNLFEARKLVIDKKANN